MKSIKKKQTGTIIALWAIIILFTAGVTIFSFLKWKKYKEVQDEAVTATLLSTSKFNKYKDDRKKRFLKCMSFIHNSVITL